MSELSTPEYWDQRYIERRNGWDMGHGHPFLPHVHAYLGDISDKSLLVVGAGPGHDAEWFSHAAKDVTALDFSSEAKKQFRTYYPDAKVAYVVADFFSADKTLRAFDIVFEHTLLCAIHQSRYADYFLALERHTKTGGTFAAIVWNKTPVDDGPPFSVPNEVVTKHLKAIGFKIHVEAPVEPSARGRENAESFILAKKG